MKLVDRDVGRVKHATSRKMASCTRPTNSVGEVTTNLTTADTISLQRDSEPPQRRGKSKSSSVVKVKVQIQAQRPPTTNWAVRWLMRVLYRVTSTYKSIDVLFRSIGGLFPAKNSAGGEEPSTEDSAELEPDSAIGPILVREDAPSLFRMLRQLTKWMGVSPSEVRLSHLPTCGVLDLSGSTGPSRKVLIIGLPCLRVWTIGEVLSVLGHEFAHLKLEDAVFTREVLQYATILQSESLLRSGWQRWFNPRVVLGRVVGSSVMALASMVSRSMEYRADRWSADCFGADHLASALEKLAIVQPIFHEVLVTYDADHSRRENVYDFLGRAWEHLPEKQYDLLRGRLLTQTRTDRSDPHPPIADRLARLRIQERVPKKSNFSALELLAEPELFERVLHNHLFGTAQQMSSQRYEAEQNWVLSRLHAPIAEP